MKKFLLSVLMATALTACGEKTETSKENEKPVVKIGAILPLTGGTSHLGEGGKKGALLAIKEINENSNNKFIYEFVYEDIGLYQNKTVSIYNKLKELDKVEALVSFNTAVGKIIKPLVKKDKIIHISSALDNDIPDNGFNYVNGYSMKDVSEEFVNYMIRNEKRRISIAVVNHASSEAVLDEFLPLLKNNNIDILSVDRFNMEQRDFKVAAMRINRLNPDVVFVYAFEPVLSLLSKQLLEENRNIKLGTFMMFAYADNSNLFNGQVFVDINNPTSNFNEKYKNEYGEVPQTSSANMYDNINLIVKIVEENGKPSDLSENGVREAMVNAIKIYDGAYGKLNLDDKGLIYSETTIKQIIDGQPVVVEE